MEQRDYVWRLMVAYRTTAGTCGVVRPAGRLLAAQLYERGVPIEAVENAFTLATVRRLMRPEGSTPLGTVRSLAYFLPVIEEVLEMKVGPNYYRYLRGKLDRFLAQQP